MRNVAFLALFLVGASGCSSSGTGSSFDPNGTPGPGNGADGGDTIGGGNNDGGLISGDGGPGLPPGCSDAAKLIYVVDDTNGLHSFYPPTLTFKDIGTLHCPAAAGATPNSMAVDRSAVAWVNYNDGTLFKVSTADASCQATTFQAGQLGWGRFGMGFASNAAGSNDETLYVAGIGHHQLATLDLGTMKLTAVGNFGTPLNRYDAELTGTGDAKLYGFFTNTPSSIAEISKTDASIVSNAPQTGVSTGTDWAFSFWGGDFYMYTANINASRTDTSNVTRYRPSDGSTTVVKQQIGFRIVGAGVSTCAPTTIPH